jgi:transcriptional regulator with XRE-family HTH domain
MCEIQQTILPGLQLGFAPAFCTKDAKQSRMALDLAALRRQKGLSLTEIARETKIGVSYLNAIEQGQFAKLPGGIYSTSYIRQYAHAIECDEDSILDRYYASAVAT